MKNKIFVGLTTAMLKSQQNLSLDDKNLNKEWSNSTSPKTVRDLFYMCLPDDYHHNTGCTMWRWNYCSNPKVKEMKSGQIKYVGTNRQEWILGNKENNFIGGAGDNDILIGAQGNDTLSGGSGDDILNGAIHIRAKSGKVGKGEIDFANGGRGNDIFMVADEYSGNYYSDFSSTSSESEDESCLIIQDFSVGDDKLQLFGSKEQYYTKEEYTQINSSYYEYGVGVYDVTTNDLVCFLEDSASTPTLRSAGGGKLDLDKIAVFI